MPELHQQLAQARETFGRFLRNWRKANGWVVTTAQDWARAAPELIPPGLRVSSGQWANLENAQVKQAQPSTFLQLAALNQALASDQRGRISDPVLRQRIASARPVLRRDGSPWGAEDWFACYIGNLQGPAELWPQPGDEPDSSSITELRQRFRQLVEQHRLRPVTAMVQLLASGKELDTEAQLEIEGSLLHEEQISPATLAQLRRLLQRWQTDLASAEGTARRQRAK